MWLIAGVMHNPVYSGRNDHTLWGPPAGSPDTVLCLGEFDTDNLHRFWSQVKEITPITPPDGRTNNEVAAHAESWLCQQPHGTWAQLWPAMRHFD
ncbi:MAG TPA: hypothetical protein VHW44_30975 [Pseudonocardiaceae bacterium]|nr:hypothetical protein [Pseudonocardiaceae bacterium]